MRPYASFASVRVEGVGLPNVRPYASFASARVEGVGPSKVRPYASFACACGGGRVDDCETLRLICSRGGGRADECATIRQPLETVGAVGPAETQAGVYANAHDAFGVEP